MLAVSSITASVRVSASANIEQGFGSEEDFTGNLVPFSAGAVYEEKPTISYLPVSGVNYATQMNSPIPLSMVAQLTGTQTEAAYIYNMLISSMNGLQNPDFQISSAPLDQRFVRVVEIMTQLSQADKLRWINSQKTPGRLLIVINNSGSTPAAEIRELLDLLGLSVMSGGANWLVVPVSLALDGRDSGGIGMTTRSVADLVEILSAAIDVPEEDIQNGVASRYPSPGLAGRQLTIRRSSTRPAQATVAVQYRDEWFYIDETDQPTKRAFRLLGALWSVAIAESIPKGSAAPVLTVPVSP